MNASMELEEETGYKARKMISLGMLYGEPSKDTYKVYGFIVTELDYRDKQKLDENEDIDVLHVPICEVDDMIRNGKICSPDTIAFLKLAQLKFPAFFE